MLNFLSLCLAIPEVLFPGEGNIEIFPGYFKKTEVSTLGTFSGSECLPGILPFPTHSQTLFPS